MQTWVSYTRVCMKLWNNCIRILKQKRKQCSFGCWKNSFFQLYMYNTLSWIRKAVTFVLSDLRNFCLLHNHSPKIIFVWQDYICNLTNAFLRSWLQNQNIKILAGVYNKPYYWRWSNFLAYHLTYITNVEKRVLRIHCILKVFMYYNENLR